METLPHELINIVAKTVGKLAILLLSHTSKQFRHIMINSGEIISEEDLAAESADLNSLSMAQYLVDIDVRITPEQCYTFAENGNLAALKYLYANGGYLCEAAIETAIECGHIDILDFALSIGARFPKYINKSTKLTNFKPVLDWVDNHKNLDIKIETMIVWSIQRPNLDLYKLLLNRCNDHYLSHAIAFGRCEIVEYIHSRGIDIHEFHAPQYHCNTRTNDVIKTVKFILNICGNKTIGAVETAIAIGDLEFLKYVAGICGYLPGSIKSNTSPEILNYLWERGCRIDEEQICAYVDDYDEHMVKFYAEHGDHFEPDILIKVCTFSIDTIKLIYAAATRHEIINNDYKYVIKFEQSEEIIIKKLEYLHGLAPGDNNLVKKACARGFLMVFKWLVNHGYSVDEEYLFAINGDHDKIISYLHDTEFPLDYDYIFNRSIMFGATKTLLLIHKITAIQNRELNINIYEGITDKCYACYFAADNWQLPALKLLRKLGYQWDERVIISTFKFNHMRLLKYALRNNCPRPDKTEVAAVKNINPQIRKILKLHNLI